MERRFLAILSCVITVFVFGAWAGVLGPLFLSIAREFSMPVEITGLLPTVTSMGSIFAITSGGFLADRFGKKPLYLIALCGLILSFGLFIFAPNYPVVAVACLLAGAMGGTLEGICSAVIADLDPPNMNRNSNLLQISFSVGAVLAIIVAANILRTGADWRMTYVILAAIAVVSLLLGFLMAMPTISHDERIDLHAARKIVTHPQVLLLAMGICLYVGSEMSLASWISPMMEGHFKYTVEAALAGSALFWLAVSIGRLGSAIACHRLPGLRVMNVLLAGGIFSFIILALPFGPWRLWAGIALAGLSFSGVWPLIISLGSARFPQFSGTVVAVLVASGTVGMLIFPSSCGFIIERISPQAGIAMMAALFVTLAGIMVVYGRKTREEKISPIPAGHLPQ